jgi:hypothetical protein
LARSGTPGADPEWISAQATLAIRHIIKICGPPPPEMELEAQWQERELGGYPTIVLLWEDPCAERRGIILKGFRLRLRLTRTAVNFFPAGQYGPSVRKTRTQIVLPSILYNASPHPPDTLDVFESQRYPEFRQG